MRGIKNMENMRIYVASLADYNAGKLHGVWIDACDDPEEIEEKVSTMLEASTEPDAEEYAIHDHVGFMGFELSEFESLEFVSWLARMIDAHGEAFVSFLKTFEPAKLSFRRENRESATLDFEECFCGTWESETDFAKNFADERGFLDHFPDEMKKYFDYTKLARDLFQGDYSFSRGAVFRNL